MKSLIKKPNRISWNSVETKRFVFFSFCYILLVDTDIETALKVFIRLLKRKAACGCML